MTASTSLPQESQSEMGHQTAGVYYVNGKFVPAGEAVIPVDDLAVVRGYAVFESLRTYGGKPFRLPDHLARLRRSGDLIGLALPWSTAELTRLVAETLARNGHPEASIRIVVTGGVAGDLFTPAETPGLIVMVRPLYRYPAMGYESGVKLATASSERYLPEAKTIHYIAGVRAMQESRRLDPEIAEVLFVDRQGLVTEGITSNVFAFLGDVLVTPGRDILYGVTRGVVLELAQAVFELQLRELPVSELANAEEVFITGSVKEILPVRAIDGRPVGTGAPGPRTRRLMAMYNKMTAAFAAS